MARPTPPGTAIHNLTMYRASSGALVFGAGTVNWSWGLDGTTTRRPRCPTSTSSRPRSTSWPIWARSQGHSRPAWWRRRRRATRRADVDDHRARRGRQPAERHAGHDHRHRLGHAADRSAASRSRSTTARRGTRRPGRRAGATRGRPAHPAPITIRSRATDDSGNIETPPDSRNVNGHAARLCPCTIFPSAVPTDSGRSRHRTRSKLGVKFRVDQAGFIRASASTRRTTNTGTHIGSLWSTTGTLLAQATFTGESASGWQQVDVRRRRSP